jgi:MFS family permease
MYTTVRGLPESTTAGPAGKAVAKRRVGRTVVLLGTVSLFTDLSSEMVVAVLPVYLTLVLGLTPLQYGIIDGLYQGVTAAVRIVGGLGADLTRRPKVVAVIGYGLSCVCKLLFLPAQTFAAISAVVALDRSGKGVRTAPRDAMIAGASAPESLGYAFGVHRTMDTVGALGGPLLAFGILALLVDGYDAIFMLSFSLAAVGVAILVLFVPNRPSSPAAATGTTDDAADDATPDAPRRGLRAAVRDVAGLVLLPSYRRVLGVAALLSLATISDGFVYLTLKDKVGLGAALFPLLFVGTSAAYLLLAIPLGRLADRIGRRRVFIGGHAVAALAYAALWLLPPGPALVVGVLALVGTYYACTDGVLPALTVPIVPETVRSSGIAGVQTVMALGSLGSAVLFGVLWARWGQQTAVATFAVVLAVLVVVATRLLAGVERPAGDALPVA